MAFSRYQVDYKLYSSQLGTARKTVAVRTAIASGYINIVRQFTSTGDDRLDTLAGTIYGDSKYWWILAAASNIGWGLQIPPGTIINVVDLREVERL
jgi:hypothetical protein